MIVAAAIGTGCFKMTYRGTGIWSYALRSVGAILLQSVPETIEGRNICGPAVQTPIRSGIDALLPRV